MTRSLHDSLRGLGFDKLLAKAAHDMPDARDRLDYVARMTEQAAQKVLNATDAAGPLQNSVEHRTLELAAAWNDLMSAHFTKTQVRELAARSQGLFAENRADIAETKKHLMDIMMAQDFQDLTGQVIKRVTELAQGIEQQLVQLLLDYAPGDVKRDANGSLMNGPQINSVGHDIVADQGQVDDLLDSLGF